jgi:hypothetical protein
MHIYTSLCSVNHSAIKASSSFFLTCYLTFPSRNARHLGQPKDKAATHFSRSAENPRSVADKTNRMYLTYTAKPTLCNMESKDAYSVCVYEVNLRYA